MYGKLQGVLLDLYAPPPIRSRVHHAMHKTRSPWWNLCILIFVNGVTPFYDVTHIKLNINQ